MLSPKPANPEMPIDGMPHASGGPFDAGNVELGDHVALEGQFASEGVVEGVEPGSGTR